MGVIALHVGGGGVGIPMLAAVAAAVAGSGLLLGLGLAALLRRRSRPYLLVAAALAALFARAVVAALSMTGHLTPTDHHLVEHGLDAVTVALVVGAVYHARWIERQSTAGSDRPPSGARRRSTDDAPAGRSFRVDGGRDPPAPDDAGTVDRSDVRSGDRRFGGEGDGDGADAVDAETDPDTGGGRS